MQFPAFHLFDEDSRLIDPISGENRYAFYIPKQTCGGSCHDYGLITGGGLECGRTGNRYGK